MAPYKMQNYVLKMYSVIILLLQQVYLSQLHSYFKFQRVIITPLLREHNITDTTKQKT